MARLILDTTVLVGGERNAGELDSAITDEDDVAIAAVTAAELLVGVEMADARRRPARERFVTSILETITVEDYDLSVARSHAHLLAYVKTTGRPRGAHDLIIAATAEARDRMIITTDSSGFADLPAVAVREAR